MACAAAIAQVQHRVSSRGAAGGCWLGGVSDGCRSCLLPSIVTCTIRSAHLMPLEMTRLRVASTVSCTAAVQFMAALEVT